MFGKHDRSSGAASAANAAAITSPRVYYHLLGSDTITHGPELTRAHAPTAPVAQVAVDFSSVFRPEHHGVTHAESCPHGQAIRAVAVADTPDKRSLEGPDSMAESLPLDQSKAGQSLFFGQHLQAACIRAREVARANRTYQLNQS